MYVFHQVVVERDRDWETLPAPPLPDRSEDLCSRDDAIATADVAQLAFEHAGPDGRQDLDVLVAGHGAADAVVDEDDPDPRRGEACEPGNHERQ